MGEDSRTPDVEIDDQDDDESFIGVYGHHWHGDTGPIHEALNSENGSDQQSSTAENGERTSQRQQGDGPQPDQHHADEAQSNPEEQSETNALDTTVAGTRTPTQPQQSDEAINGAVFNRLKESASPVLQPS